MGIIIIIYKINIPSTKEKQNRQEKSKAYIVQPHNEQLSIYKLLNLKIIKNIIFLFF